MTAAAIRPALRLLGVLLLLPVLSGCGGLLPSPPERKLYRLNPAVAFATPLPHVPAQLLVATPTAPAALDTRRIAVSPTALSLDYLAGAEWSDRVPFLVQAALVEGFEKSGAIAAVGSEGLGLRADFVLDTAVRDFEAVYDSPNRPPHVRVALTVKLVGMPGRDIIAQTSAGGEAAATANAAPAVVQAFDAALCAAVRDVVTWTLTNPALSRHHR